MDVTEAEVKIEGDVVVITLKDSRGEGGCVLKMDFKNAKTLVLKLAGLLNEKT